MKQIAPCFFRAFHAVLPALLLCITAASGAQSSAPSQADWPQRPIRVVVPFSAGGGSDMVARVLGQSLSQRLGQPVIVDNRPGAATVVGTRQVVRAAPDGYTLLLSGSTSFSVNPAVRKTLPYDPARDLAPIAIVARTSLALVVGQGTPWHSLREVIAAARASPGGVRYGTFGAGSGPHLAGEMFALAAGVQLQPIPYRTTGQLLVALNSGDVELGIEVAGALAPQVAAGKLRAVAVLGAGRSAALPWVPTLAEQGLREATFEAWFGLAAPGRTPAPVLETLSSAVTAAMGDPAVQAALRAQGMEPVALGAAAFRKETETEIARYRIQAARAGISVD
ncbi:MULTISPECIES: Bug family tripartite tricarboxylate transporter substrate binding protein [unclassified Variovorax]|uniref:Bug family tripartite tricarboxylate transporter substrate binding protein n=1 Tax=unclassified Variovorax TaxID=663243 RepID=UPI003F454014